MIPEIISHFRVLKKLGQGGMGEVYLAQDTLLDRPVALKILPAQFTGDAERMKRFVREAKAASSLNHPNVAHIYEISEFNGIHFIAMEYVEGETLGVWIRHERNLSQILDVVIQVADALARAESKGIVHRDIKPSNIVVASTGEVKLLDFGIAKIVRDNSLLETDMETRTQTEPGSVLGTVNYMSPEQIRGQSVDQRTDIFSFGVVLYEMLAGKNPFAGATVGDTIDRILHLEPDHPSRFNEQISSDLEEIIRKCLEKNTDTRYQSAKDVVSDLRTVKLRISSSQLAEPRSARRTFQVPRWLYLASGIVVLALAAFSYYRSVVNGNEIHSLAVLPFTNKSADSQTEYLSDGITDSIINNLSQLRRVRVMARTTVFQYKGKQSDPQDVGRQLHVDAVVTGDVTERGDIVTVQSELVSTRDGSQIWGEQIPGKSDDLLSLQSQISTAISQKLRLHLTGEEERLVAKRYTGNPEAYQLYLKGHYEFSKFTADGTRKAIEYLQEAIDKDPTYALAYTGLAAAYGISGALGVMVPSTAFQASRAEAEKALQLDPELAEAQLTIGATLLYALDYKDAEKSFRRAIALNSNFSDPHDLLAPCLTAQGRLDEALEEAKKAVEDDPLSLGNVADLGLAYYMKRDYRNAELYIQKAMNLDQNFETAHNYMVSILVAQKQYDRAIEEAKKAVTLGGNNSLDVAFLAWAYGISGKKTEARQMLQDLNSRAEKEYVSPYFIGLIHLGLVENEQAITLMQQACRKKDFVAMMFYLKADPNFDSIRNDPAFQDLLQCMKLS